MAITISQNGNVAVPEGVRPPEGTVIVQNMPEGVRQPEASNPIKTIPEGRTPEVTHKKLY